MDSSTNVSEKIEQYRRVRADLEIERDGEVQTIRTKTGTPLSRKMFVETLCVAQSRVGNSPLDEDRKFEHIARLQVLIDLFSYGVCEHPDCEEPPRECGLCAGHCEAIQKIYDHDDPQFSKSAGNEETPSVLERVAETQRQKTRRRTWERRPRP